MSDEVKIWTPALNYDLNYEFYGDLPPGYMESPNDATEDDDKYVSLKDYRKLEALQKATAYDYIEDIENVIRLLKIVTVLVEMALIEATK